MSITFPKGLLLWRSKRKRSRRQRWQRQGQSGSNPSGTMGGCFIEAMVRWGSREKPPYQKTGFHFKIPPGSSSGDSGHGGSAAPLQRGQGVLLRKWYNGAVGKSPHTKRPVPISKFPPGVAAATAGTVEAQVLCKERRGTADRSKHRIRLHFLGLGSGKWHCAPRKEKGLGEAVTACAEWMEESAGWRRGSQCDSSTSSNTSSRSSSSAHTSSASTSISSSSTSSHIPLSSPSSPSSTSNSTPTKGGAEHELLEVEAVNTSQHEDEGKRQRNVCTKQRQVCGEVVRVSRDGRVRRGDAVGEGVRGAAAGRRRGGRGGDDRRRRRRVHGDGECGAEVHRGAMGFQGVELLASRHRDGDMADAENPEVEDRMGRAGTEGEGSRGKGDEAAGGMPRGLYKNKPQWLVAGLRAAVVWLLSGFWNRSDLIGSDKISLLSTPASGVPRHQTVRTTPTAVRNTGLTVVLVCTSPGQVDDSVSSYAKPGLDKHQHLDGFRLETGTAGRRAASLNQQEK
ncbi:hypothetical protein DFH08DRAFT_1000859 [Mycena albidolilacea]|uniref:Uncharacterized protein n=1 Tax=Mycena albidolilacea TaxID=1033008 RepID=A0AAD7A1L4_9AGAR|nr:hypothetical protein DFH08DRAFT_1000859 [Mycena albidolilacea]